MAIDSPAAGGAGRGPVALDASSLGVRPPSRGDPEEVARALAAFVNGHIMARAHPIQPDDAFATVGIDSMALLKILLFVEAEFGFWLPDDDLREENIASPRALANYICRRRSSI